MDLNTDEKQERKSSQPIEVKPITTPQTTSIAYRSRFAVLFFAWLGGWQGKHLRYLGYEAQAEEIRLEYNFGAADVLTAEGLLRL